MGDVTAFVLAGGRSSRMGSDKALLSLGGQTLLQRALKTAGAVAAKVYIVGPRARYGEFGEVVEDIYTDCGPLGGIHAALSATSAEWNLMLSVDVPLMTAGFLGWLVQQAKSAEELIVVPDALGGLQPLCAVYRTAVRESAAEALRNGDYKIGHLFATLPTRQITLLEIVAAGFSPDVFRNINTSEEYGELLKQSAGRGAPEQEGKEIIDA